MMRKMGYGLRLTGLFFLLLLTFGQAFGEDKIYPDKPNPPVLVNDYAHILSPDQVAQLEQKLDDFARTTSTQITIVTIKNLGGHDVEEYSVEVFNRWGLGEAGKNNGVLLLASLDDRKAWITVGKGLEGVLTDAKSGLIFRNELRPAFQQGDYYGGLSKSADAIIAVTKGEYTSDGLQKDNHVPLKAIIVIIIFIVIILRILRGGGGGGGNYVSGRGFGGLASGLFWGSMLGGGWGDRGGNSGGWGDRGGNSGGWGGGGGGGFGGFGGGSTGGGGAGGSW